MQRSCLQSRRSIRHREKSCRQQHMRMLTYISEGNKMIESFIYARDTEPQSDVDQGFYWGLRDINGRERKIYNTFKVIDSKESLDKTKNLLSYTDLSSWTQIPGIKKSTFKNNRSIKNKWPLVQSTSLYVCLADDNWRERQLMSTTERNINLQ